MIEFYWQRDGTRMFQFLASCWRTLVTEPEMSTTAEVAEYLGASSAGSGRKFLSRRGRTTQPGTGAWRSESLRCGRDPCGEGADAWTRKTILGRGT